MNLHDGTTHGGSVVRESDGERVLRDVDGKDLAIAKQRIRERTGGGSAMPSMGELLDRRAVRDLLEFLARRGN